MFVKTCLYKLTLKVTCIDASPNSYVLAILVLFFSSSMAGGPSRCLLIGMVFVSEGQLLVCPLFYTWLPVPATVKVYKNL